MDIGVDREVDNGRRRCNMICFTVWACRAHLPTSLVKVMLLSCVAYGEKICFRYICITICVHVLIKAGGLGCTGWGGGGLSPQRANTPHVTFEHICVKVVIFFLLTVISLLSEALWMQIYVYNSYYYK